MNIATISDLFIIVALLFAAACLALVVFSFFQHKTLKREIQIREQRFNEEIRRVSRQRK